MAELCARVDQGALRSHDVLPPFFHRFFGTCFFPTYRSRPRTDHRLCCLGTPILYHSFPYRKLHQVLLASSQDVWYLLYISFLCRWRGKAMPEIRVIHRRSGGRGTREASRDYLDLEERRSKLRTLLVACPRAPYKPLQGPICPKLLRAQFFPSTHTSKRTHRLFYEASFRTRSHSLISL